MVNLCITVQKWCISTWKTNLWYNLVMLKKALLLVGTIAIIFVIAVVITYGYLWLKIVFTYQCQIYDGSGFDQEQRDICDNYNSGGLYKVLTN